MIEILIRNIGRFIFLVLLQGIILNNIVLTDLGISPYFYVLFIILLPFETPGWLMLILAFILGGSIDIFADTFGIHAASCLFLAFIRPAILNINSPRDGYESGTLPRISYYGSYWFLRYSIPLILAFQIFYSFLEAFTFDNIMITMLRILLNTILTSVLIFISQFIVYSK